MALSVVASQNQKTWDATVRVTGGHPLQLWGIGQSQLAAEAGGLQLDRVVARDDQERMVGYGQLQIRQESIGGDRGSTTVVECLNVHANRATAVPALLDALAAYAERVWGAEMFSAELDAPSSPELVEAIGVRGWQRTGAVAEGDGGPRRLRVNLGSSERDLSSRLPEQTLERCRSGLRVSGVTVREITPDSGDVRAAGLKTQQISRLLRELGQDSLLLVATQEKADDEPAALGYLWFVHTVGQAMLYRVGFTRTARELGIDDALLLTGAVELQKRGVQRLDGGDAADPDVPTVVRELADRQRVILGPWRKPLGDVAAQPPGSGAEAAEPAAGPSPETHESPARGRRGLFGRRPRQETDATSTAAGGDGSEAEGDSASSNGFSTASYPEPASESAAAATGAAADRAAAKRRDVVRRQVSSDLGFEGTDQTPAPSSTAVQDPTQATDTESSGTKTPPTQASGAKSSDAQGSDTKTTEAAAYGAKGSARKKAGRPAPAATQVAADEATASSSKTPGPSPKSAADEPDREAGPAEPGSPSTVDRETARSQRRAAAEQRRAERLARKAAEVEAQRKPKKPPLARRLRDEAGAAMRDALGR